MAKYSKEFKLKVVKYCIENYHTSYEAAKKNLTFQAQHQ